jgi:eukaryotic-like serine/threonine-protein kinase
MPSITDSIGRVLGGRYRLVTALGTGASAHVYLADDVTLHRRVAIKVLHPALSGDESFLRRFRAEARAVAALNHPNILQVFDWGEEGGEPYLVLEYLAGGSLRQVFDTKYRLSPEQAVHVGIEAAAGLDYAHRRGLVHRDIKPANLLFDADRRLRIADFGLARALAEAAWTEPEGAILGTARYAAPEQVEGWVLDGKADVYALALVLYEGVTGEAAFVGDTTVATLMARVGTLLPEHPALGPLNEVLAWAAAPDPSERFDAAELGLRLRALAIALPDPEPIPLVTTDRADAVDDDVTLLIGAAWDPSRAEPADATEIGAPTPAGLGSKRRRHRRGAVVDAEPAGEGAEEGEEASKPPRRWPWVAAVVLLGAVLVAGAVDLAVRARIFTPSHPVPSLLGKSIPQAEHEVRPDHFTVRTTGHLYSLTLAEGLIFSQQPTASKAHHPVTAKEGSVIDVMVSAGLPPVTVPDLSSFASCTDAVKALAAVHLVGVCPDSAARYSSTVVAGAVITSVPTGSAPYGSTVTIVTSKGHAPVVVPPVTGPNSSYASASAALTAAGFVPAENKEYNNTVPAGQVLGTSPAPTDGPQPYGSTVAVDVSLGPQPVPIPNLAGRSVAAATKALQGLGFHAGGPYGPPGATTVAATDPTAGSTALPGSTVNLYTR